ncbi:bacterial low temperature requirement A protein-domain-containing protein [Bisporella sp. PMI_857]|nr:bacterial low temperature requirement A protein-domain-containing protein [Bisporella sp. PMI_857]
MHETPQFERHDEATNIELFYDLFFVANLTTFTSLHEINEADSLKSYAGFFCILWFAWFQVSLFDVRFVADSILERIAKASQFATMVGLAVVGPKFDPAKQDANTFKTMALILMFGRLVLALQYLVVLFHVRNWKRSKTPMAMLSLVYVFAGLVYGLTWFGFKKGVDHGHTYVVWYVIAIAETVLNIAVTSRWKVVTFKGTHLVQRMSLLTLIILGEGIIVVCKSISKIVKNQKGSFAWTPATVGTITSAVVVIYFLYMLYFDWYSHHHFGSIRQQFWAIIHFPFHLALVLSMEGIAQFIIWRKLIEVIQYVDKVYSNAYLNWLNDQTTSLSDLPITLNATASQIFASYPPIYAYVEQDVQTYLLDITSAFNTLNDPSTNPDVIISEVQTAVDNLFATIQNSLFDTYGVVIPDKKYSVTNPTETLNHNFEVFELVFIYFFVTAGFTLLLMNTLNFLSKRKKSKSDWARSIFNYIIGVVLCVIAGAVKTNKGIDLLTSSWVIPTVAIALTVVLIVNHTHRFWKD